MKIPQYVISTAPFKATDKEIADWIYGNVPLMKMLVDHIKSRSHEFAPKKIGRPGLNEMEFVPLLRSLASGKENAMNQASLVARMQQHRAMSYTGARAILRRLASVGMITFERGEYPWSPVMVWFNDDV